MTLPCWKVFPCEPRLTGLCSDLSSLILTWEPYDSDHPSKYPTNQPPFVVEDRRVQRFCSMSISPYMFFPWNFNSSLSLHLSCFSFLTPSPCSLLLSLINSNYYLWSNHYVSGIMLSSLHLSFYLILTIPYVMSTINISSLQVKALAQNSGGHLAKKWRK